MSLIFEEPPPELPPEPPPLTLPPLEFDGPLLGLITTISFEFLLFFENESIRSKICIVSALEIGFNGLNVPSSYPVIIPLFDMADI